MGRSRLPAALLPPGLIIEQVQIDDGRGRGERAFAEDRVDLSGLRHAVEAGSQPLRVIRSDLPAHGRRVRIKLTVRRFRRGSDRCPRVIFAERFGDDIVAP